MTRELERFRQSISGELRFAIDILKAEDLITPLALKTGYYEPDGRLFTAVL